MSPTATPAPAFAMRATKAASMARLAVSDPQTNGTRAVFSANASTDPAGPISPVATASRSTSGMDSTLAADQRRHRPAVHAHTGQANTQQPRRAPPKAPGQPNRTPPAPAEAAMTRPTGTVTMMWPTAIALVVLTCGTASGTAEG